MKTAIIGLGYVGLPLLLLAEKRGKNVVGYDTDKSKIESIKRGVPPIDDPYVKEQMKKVGDLKVSSEEEIISDSQIYIITVPTPVKENTPDYSYVKSATRTVSQNIDKGDIIVLESTVAPGTCRKILTPIIEEKSGLEVGEEIFFAFCPERVDPGNEKWNIENIPRVLGAISDKGLDIAYNFYNEILNGEIFRTSSIEVAEASKVTENSFRDINIAFANEMAKIYDNLGISAKEVIKAADTKPFGFMAHWPGCGVGGHCIPVDPYYLIKESSNQGYQPPLLEKSREINDSMPSYTVRRTMEGLNEAGKPVKGSKIALLGLAYKGGVDDTRMSPALKIKNKLEELGAEVVTVDPYVDEADYSDFDEIKEDIDCIVLATDHKDFESINPQRNTVLIDGKNQLGHLENEVEVYISVGGR